MAITRYLSERMLHGRGRYACRRVVWLVLTICLLLAQMLWLTHQLQHQLQHDRMVCTTCLGLAGTHAPVTPPPLTVTRPPVETFDPPPCDLSAGRPSLPVYQSRAPPRLPS